MSKIYVHRAGSAHRVIERAISLLWRSSEASLALAYVPQGYPAVEHLFVAVPRKVAIRYGARNTKVDSS